MTTDSIVHFMEVTEQRFRYMPMPKRPLTFEEIAERLDELKRDRPEEYRLFKEGKTCLCT